MYALIDTTNSRPIACHSSYVALAALGYIQFANVDMQIISLHADREFAALSADELAAIGEQMQIGLSGDYGHKVAQLRAALLAADWLVLPYTTEQLEQQAYGIHPQDGEPRAFDPQGGTAKQMARWHFEPQRNRKRIDCAYGVNFSAGVGYGAGVAPPAPDGYSSKPSAPAVPRSRPGANPAPTKPPRAPRAAPSGPATRPKGGTTARVWEICDIHEAGRDGGDLKAMRKSIIAACEAEGINASTASVQYGKWKSSKGL